VYFVEHSTKTAPKDPDKTWVSDEEGNALHWPLSDYGEEGSRAENWLAGASPSTIASSPPMLSDLTAASMVVERVEEPEEVLAQGRTGPSSRRTVTGPPPSCSGSPIPPSGTIPGEAAGHEGRTCS
jgi:hypothetical protein